MNTLDQYNSVIDKCRSLFIKKMKDYGSAWRILRLPSLTDQLYIKAQRIRGLQENKEHKIDEDETTEFIGIINYALMALIQIEKGIMYWIMIPISKLPTLSYRSSYASSK